jgi:DNA-binding response OmpR family regulator
MKKVLVIDDEARMRGLLATILEREGYAMLLAESGPKGWDLFRWERPDLIVLDLKLPERDGITVLQDIRGVDVETPVVVLARAGTVKTRKQVRELGATAFIEKDLLLHRLREHLLRLLLLPDHSSSQPSVEMGHEHILGQRNALRMRNHLLERITCETLLLEQSNDLSGKRRTSSGLRSNYGCLASL